MSALNILLERAGGRGSFTDVTPALLLRRALGRALEVVPGADADLGEVTTGSISPHAAAALCAEDGLLALLEGPSGQVGALALPVALTRGLVGLLMIGALPDGAANPRPVTRVEGAMLGPFIDDVLERFSDSGTNPDVSPSSGARSGAGAAAESDPDDVGQPRFMFGSIVRDRRAMRLGLENGPMQKFTLPISLGPECAGDLMVFFPPKTNVDGQDDTHPAAKLGDALQASPTELTAVLGRVSLPYNKLQVLQTGDVLTLPPRAPLEASLIMRGGEKGFSGQIGRLDSMRAFRITARGANEGRAELQDRLSDPPLVDDMPIPPDVHDAAGAPVAFLADQDDEIIQSTFEPGLETEGLGDVLPEHGARPVGLTGQEDS